MTEPEPVVEPPVVEPPVVEPPVVEPPVVEPPVVELVETPRRRRRFGWLIALVVVAVLLVAGFLVADALARQFATDTVRDRVVEVLALDPGTPVEVELGPGSVLLQLVAGALDRVDVRVDELAFGEITGAATVAATRVPLDGGTSVERLRIEVTVDEANVRKLASFLSASELTSIDLGDGVVRVGTEFTLLFFTIPISVDLAPSAVDGGISFDPRTIILGEEEISVQDLRDSPQFRVLAGELLDSRDFCVASHLPRALTIDDVDVIGSSLVVSINGDGTALSDPDLATMGTCPAAG